MANTKHLSKFNLELVKRKKLQLKLFTWTIYSVFIAIILNIFTNPLVAFIYFLISSFIMKEFYLAKNIPNILVNGYLGEKNCLKLLKKLPKKFIIFNQIEIPSPLSKYNEFETDFMVIGKNTLFIVECKNFIGTISCKNEHEDWIKEEYDQYGNIKKHFLVKSPFKQIKRQKDSLKKFLLKLNLELEIFTILFLNMKEKDVNLPTVPEIPVFTNNQLMKYIKNVDKERNSFKTTTERSYIIDILISINQESINSRKARLTNKQYLLNYYEKDQSTKTII